MALELMIRRSLYGSAKLVALAVEAFSLRTANYLVASPRVDDELDEDHFFGVEKEQNLIQPVDDLRRFVGSARFEITFFKRMKRCGINQNADQSMRRRGQRLLTISAASRKANIGRMLEQLKLEG